MSKVLTFARRYPANHPRKGEPTFFVEQLWNSLSLKIGQSLLLDLEDINFDYAILKDCLLNTVDPTIKAAKNHTIRVGHRWKVGDKFSPRVWSDKPYKSKQIIIAPDVEITNVHDFRIEVDGNYIAVMIDGHAFYEENSEFVTQVLALETLAKNDGLSLEDFKSWFKWGKPFGGQIISWNPKIEY